MIFFSMVICTSFDSVNEVATFLSFCCCSFSLTENWWSLWFLSLALSCPTPSIPENSVMKGNNFTYGSKVTFRYYLHPLQHQAAKVTVRVSSITTLKCFSFILFSAVWKASCHRFHMNSSVCQVWHGAGLHMHVTQLPVGGLQWLEMQTIDLDQILTSLWSHIPAKKDTGMATYLSATLF